MSTPRSVFVVALTTLVVLAVGAPALAGAYATVVSPPSASPSSELPDGRVYELATPFNKHGYGAGANSNAPGLSVSSQDGNAVSFDAKGPASELNSSGTNSDFVAERTVNGWTSRAATARGLHQNEEISAFLAPPIWLDYTPDLSQLVYDIGLPEAGGDTFKGNANLYLLGRDPLVEPTWLLRDAIQIKGDKGNNLDEQFPGMELLGISPDASVVYVADEARLLPQDALRSGWGIYEYRGGVLSEAGVLPDGSVPPSGALPPTAINRPNVALGENNPASFDNQVSEDGKRMLFVSSGELFVHKLEADGSEHSQLVSASQVPGHVGEAASDGVAAFENTTSSLGSEKSGPTYAYASSDGSHVFFQSVDRLTGDAPSGGELKVYDFDVDTGLLEYLPGVVLGGIVTAAPDGSKFAFVKGSGSSPELDIWSAGPAGGSVDQISQLPGGGYVGPGRIVAGNSILVFQAQAPISGFNNSGGEQVYRYDVSTNELDCLSCPPEGIKASGDTYLSGIDSYHGRTGNPKVGLIVNDERGVSNDGQRVFFTSPDPLTGRDANGARDAYEWENGTVYLVSSGTSSEPSYFLDNSESGDDVFIATTDELLPGDNDAGFDVYDARVPRPGDNPPPAAAPCEGAACQGPPSVPQLLGPPPSAIFDGVGNLQTPTVGAEKTTAKRLSRAQKLASALRACHKQRSKTRRKMCEKQTRKRYLVAGASTMHNLRRVK